MDTAKRIPAPAVLVLQVLPLLAVIGCSATRVSPISGTSFAPEVDEQRMWARAKEIDSSLQARGFVIYRPDLDAYFHTIIDRLRPHLGIGDATIQVYVLKDPFLNAFAMPNGTLYVHSGLLAQIENEAQLATVLGHEIAHFAKRHALTAMRSAENRATVAQVATGILAVLAVVATRDLNAGRVFANLGQSLSEPILQAQLSGYARDLEREADRDAFAALVRAGYDPRAAPQVFLRLQDELREAELAEPYFFGSHPTLSERIANAQEALDEWQPSDASQRVAAEAYRQMTADIVLDNIELDLAIGRYERARATATRCRNTRPDVARVHFLLGESCRRGARNAQDRLDAIAAYSRAAQLDPAHAAAFRELGLLHRDARQAEAASTSLQRYLELAPNAPDRGIVEAFVREEQARLEAAR